MRVRGLDERFRQLRRRDWLALIVLVIYAFLGVSAQLGANVAGQGLDPVWAAARQRGMLRVGTDFGYVPFTGTHPVTTNGQTHDEPYGYDIDLARAIGAKVGLKVEFVPTSLESAYEALANDQADAIISALPYAPEQGWRAMFSTFYFNAGQVLVVPENSRVQSSDQVSGLKIGVALGSDADTYARSLADRDPTISLQATYDTSAQALADLRRGQLDAVIADNTAALIGMNNGPGLRFVPPALTLEPYAIAVSNRAFLLRDRINVALEELRKEGWFEANGQKWFREGVK